MLSTHPDGPSEFAEIRFRGGLRGSLPLLGPAFVAAIAYVDPGNFATSIAGGGEFGHLLLWVILVANLMAMLIQNLSGQDRRRHGTEPSRLAREHLGRRTSFGLWIQTEITAMATDLAEFVGAARAPMPPPTICWARARARRSPSRSRSCRW